MERYGQIGYAGPPLRANQISETIFDFMTSVRRR